MLASRGARPTDLDPDARFCQTSGPQKTAPCVAFMAAPKALLPSLRVVTAACVMVAASSCTSWTYKPSKEMNEFKAAVKSLGGHGDMAGVDPRAQQIERDLGVGR